MSGYKAINLKVCWNGFLSNRFPLKQGVRQGDVLSPMLFSVYLDELLGILSESGCGLSLGTLFLGCIAYADDIVLLSTSAIDLTFPCSMEKNMPSNLMRAKQNV
jgi:hypothetical protein